MYMIFYYDDVSMLILLRYFSGINEVGAVILEINGSFPIKKALKALKLLHEKGRISKDCVMMVDEMYLQKCVQYSNGEYIGEDFNGDLFKGIVVFVPHYIFCNCSYFNINFEKIK